ncbi:unnamed protein product, partial [Effrenium voratum]
GGPGVPGEVLDQLREDLQALLGAKRKAQEARQQLDEKEAKIQTIRQELRSTKLEELEDDVANAKAEAKSKAEELESAGDLAESQKHRDQGKELLQAIVEVENEVAAIQKRLAKLQDERVQLEESAQEHEEQTSKLKEKREEIQRQKDQCQDFLDGLAGIERDHQDKKEACEVLRQQLAAARAEHPGRAVRREVGDWQVSPQILAPGFSLAASGGADGSWRLLRLLRLADQVLPALRREDGDADGRLEASELARALRKLAGPGRLGRDVALVFEDLGQTGLDPQIRR